MNQPPNNLERLITRYIDEECSPEERKREQPDESVAKLTGN